MKQAILLGVLMGLTLAIFVQIASKPAPKVGPDYLQNIQLK